MADGGTIVFNTKVDTTGVDVGMAKLETKLNKSTAAVNKQSAAVQKLEADLQKLKSAQVPTAQFAELQTAMKKADAELQALIDRQEKFLATGGSMRSQTWVNLQYDIERAGDKVREYQARMDAMVADGTAFTQDSIGVQQLSNNIDEAKLKLKELQISEMAAAQSLKEATNPVKMGNLTKSTNKATGSFKRFGVRLKEVIRSALVFTVITQLLAKFREYIGEAALSNDELRTALGRVKGALQSAFAPILTAILPVLTTLTNALATAINYITAFFRALGGGGSSSANEATATLSSNTEDATASLMGEVEALDSVSEASDKAAKSLAGFDEIQQLTTQTSSSSSPDGVDPIKPIFETATLSPEFAAYAERIGKAFERIGAALKRISDTKSFQEFVKYLEEFVKTNAVITLDLLGNSLDLIADTLTIIDDILVGDWKKAWEDSGSLIKTIQEYFRLFGVFMGGPFVIAILGFINKWSPAVEAWWKNNVTPWFTSERWANLAGGIKAGVMVGWAKYVEWWSNTAIGKWWIDNVEPYFTAEKWTKLMAGVKTGFENGFKAAVNAAIAILNSMIAFVNAALQFDLPGIPKLGIPSAHVTLGHLNPIPYLAQGKVVPPMAKTSDYSGSDSGSMMSGRQFKTESGATSGDRTIVMQLDGREFGRAVVDVYGKETQRVGVVLGALT